MTGPQTATLGRARRAIVPSVAAVLGIAVGAIAVLTFQDTTPPDKPVAPSTTVAALAAQAPVPTTGLLLAWTPGGLPTGIAAQTAENPAVDGVTVVRSDIVGLERSTGVDGNVVDEPAPPLTIPLEVMVFDPTTYPTTVAQPDRPALKDLAPDEALLGSTSARLRRVGPGGTLTMAGVTLHVAGVVDDQVIGAAEVAITRASPLASDVTTPRYMLIRHQGDRAAVEGPLRAALPAGTSMQLRAPGETPFLRASDAVLPQVLIKEHFGEFAWQPPPPGQDDFILDPAWVAANIVDAEVPILGHVRCHRALVPALTRALDDLVQQDLAGLVDPSTFQGCFVPRMTRSGSGISRHAWGAAVDINFADNQTGVASAQDERLVAAMARAGFTWGGGWLVPDPAHFEYVQPPAT